MAKKTLRYLGLLENKKKMTTDKRSRIMQLGISSNACNLPHKQRFMACLDSEIILFSPMQNILKMWQEAGPPLTFWWGEGLEKSLDSELCVTIYSVVS